MKILFRIIFCLFFVVLQNTGYCDSIIIEQTNQTQLSDAYLTDLSMALKLSKETGQKVIIIFSANWCGFCKTLKNDLKDIHELDNKIVCILDIEIEKKIARQFKIRTLPTSIILNSDGEEITRIVGYEKIPYTKWLKEYK